MKKVLAITYLLPGDLNSGGRLYTYHLFKSLSQYTLVTAIGLDYGEKEQFDNWVQKVIAVPRFSRPQIFSFLSKYPNIVYQTYTRAFTKILKELAQGSEEYDAIVCSFSSTFWAAEIFNAERMRLGKARLPTVLITHNYDTPLREALAKNEFNFLKSLAFYIDAKKTRAYEHRVFSAADKITAITSDDAKIINAVSGKDITVLTPGFNGKSKDTHLITQSTNRKVVLLGSYHWAVKQLNLKQLIQAAESAFTKANINLVVVGDGPASLFKDLSCYPFVTIVGRVDSFDKYFEDARLAVIAETTGGGFKLKSLDYIFSKIPMAVLQDTMVGLPLKPDIDYLSYSTLKELVEGIVQQIDNVDKLNMLAANAFSACQDKFKWEDRGTELYRLVREVTE